eukprot:TRINITY_DN1747_c1_g3_i1.p1 TRINITY_DN1747_c1_g3~~TRINITY_DN1747_c1_g3_i1.p1  ORF type:complete len:552 (-),score=94.27 TRINITY_DN1747_c1_g3_i1:18-1673(-)
MSGRLPAPHRTDWHPIQFVVDPLFRDFCRLKPDWLRATRDSQPSLLWLTSSDYTATHGFMLPHRRIGVDISNGKLILYCFGFHIPVPYPIQFVVDPLFRDFCRLKPDWLRATRDSQPSLLWLTSSDYTATHGFMLPHRRIGVDISNGKLILYCFGFHIPEDQPFCKQAQERLHKLVDHILSTQCAGYLTPLRKHIDEPQWVQFGKPLTDLLVMLAEAELCPSLFEAKYRVIVEDNVITNQSKQVIARLESGYGDVRMRAVACTRLLATPKERDRKCCTHCARVKELLSSRKAVWGQSETKKAETVPAVSKRNRAAAADCADDPAHDAKRPAHAVNPEDAASPQLASTQPADRKRSADEIRSLKQQLLRREHTLKEQMLKSQQVSGNIAQPPQPGTTAAGAFRIGSAQLVTLPSSVQPVISTPARKHPAHPQLSAAAVAQAAAAAVTLAMNTPAQPPKQMHRVATRVEPIVVPAEKRLHLVVDDTASVHTADDGKQQQQQQQACQACRRTSNEEQMVVCDACESTFCLRPPVDIDELGDSTWYCPLCAVKTR